ncbi:MAG: hypothetical protein IT463_05765 [Planctomycetes bacterium]|nr:hypothetical protein [Planctomycetota bacterium]
MRIALSILLLCAALLAGCRNAPAEEREMVRAEVGRADTPERADTMRDRLRAALAGSNNELPDGDPHMRATAAQGLGDLGDAADAWLLLEVMAGQAPDRNNMVRLECAIALGKLRYSGSRDERRLAALRALRMRAVQDRDENGRLIERDFLVRNAMVNTLAELGGRDAASALHDIAQHLEADLAASAAEAEDKGLLDRCLANLVQVTGVAAETAAANRAATDSLKPHLAWWADRVAEMPEG